MFNNDDDDFHPSLRNLSRWEFDFDIPEPDGMLASNVVTSISNAWSKGVLIDDAGRLWVQTDKLHTILRTSTNQAAYLVNLITNHNRRRFRVGNQEVGCVCSSEVARLLDELIQNPGTLTQRTYGQYSWELYSAMRDHPEVDRIVALHVDRVNALLPTLKKKRIQEFGIKNDELTLHPLRRGSQFSHIRGKRAYPHYATEVWNGLVINEDTHTVITRKKALDEEHLLDLCEEFGWSNAWYPHFAKALPE